MIVVDTSALMSILLTEADNDTFIAALADRMVVLSAGTLVEALRVASLRRGPQGGIELRRLMRTYAIGVVPVDEHQADLADDGNLRFGKGRRAPPAVLNFGDLFAYALARKLDAPLLFKGDDFRQTDIRPALPA